MRGEEEGEGGENEEIKRRRLRRKNGDEREEKDLYFDLTLCVFEKEISFLGLHNSRLNFCSVLF
jgi:hypothetical protein